MFSWVLIMLMKATTVRIIVVLFALSFSTRLVAQSDEGSMTVFIFNSWNPEFYFTKAQVSGIQDQLRTKKKEIQFIVEYMDLPRLKGIPRDKFMAAYYQLFRNKYLSRKIDFDVIYVTDDPALEFMSIHRDEFFPNVPVVFSGINNFESMNFKGKEKEYIGITEKVDYLGTFSLALKLHPNAKRFIIVGDLRETSQGQIREIKHLEPSLPIQFVYLDNLPFRQLAMKLKNLNDDDIVFRVAFYTDPVGGNMTLNESMQFLRDNLNVPLYSFWKGVLGKGIIGGKLLSGYEHGQQAVNKFYQSEHIQRYDVGAGDNPYMFDYEQLTYFGIELNRLPESSIIINQPFSFFGVYKTLVISTFIFISILLLLLIFLLYSISIRKLATEKAKAADRSKSEFISVISHELRTPMNGIMGGLQMVKEPLSQSHKETAMIIQRSADDMMRLINDIITYAELQGDLLYFNEESFDLLACFNKLRHLYEPLCKEKALNSSWQYDQALPKWIKTDKEKLGLVISKLLDNAVRFTERGRIAFSASCNKKGDQLRLVCTINDTGIGIAETAKTDIFKVFQQIDMGFKRKYGGLGIGLANCKELVNIMGGALGVESKPAKGTTFTLDIPISEGVAKASSSDKNYVLKATHPILVVEDNVVNQQVLVAMLRKLGYKSLIANHGQEALDILEKQDVSLVLLDLQMPVMDGFSCAKAIRSRDDNLREIPIVAVTANVADADKERCFQEGMNDYLPKPVRYRCLEDALARYLTLPNEPVIVDSNSLPGLVVGRNTKG